MGAHFSLFRNPERSKGSYRYGYQGLYSEEDEKTSWHSFELRQYDSDIGRWLSIDPYGQYASPYVAMGNAPNMMLDMDGGWSWTTAAIGAAVGVGVGYVASGGDWRYAVAGGLAGGALGGAAFNSSTKSGYFSGEINTTFSKTSYSFNPIGFSTAASLTASIARGADGYLNMQHQLKFAQFEKIVQDPFTGSMADGSVYFEDVRVYGSEVGDLKNGAAFTLPGVGIFVNPKDMYNIDLLRHEFGHVLQARKWGMDFFYGTIVPVSLESANRANNDWTFIHQDTWTEWTANFLSWQYFGKPSDWNSNYQLSPSKIRRGSLPPMRPSKLYLK